MLTGLGQKGTGAGTGSCHYPVMDSQRSRRTESTSPVLVNLVERGKPVALLLCEFARKKENPSLERYIAPPSGFFVVYGPQHADAPPTIASFSAEPPVIRGPGRSHASSCLFVRD